MIKYEKYFIFYTILFMGNLYFAISGNGLIRIFLYQLQLYV